MQKVVICGVLMLGALMGCTAVKIPAAIGGSKSDGVITMAYSVRAFEKPVVDWEQVRRDALARCKAWGYGQAEAFGGARTNCEAVNGYGNCVRQTVMHDYQCIN